MSVSGASGTNHVAKAWTTFDYKTAEQKEVDKIGAAGTAEKERLQARVDEFGDTRDTWKTAMDEQGVQIAVGIAAGAALGLTAGLVLRHFAHFSPGAVFASAGAGLMAGMGLGMGVPTPARRTMNTPEWQARHDEYLRRERELEPNPDRVLQPQPQWQRAIAFHDTWKVGEVNEFDTTLTVRDGGYALENAVRPDVLNAVAIFDHNGDGLIDLRKDSPELVRDSSTGGPVTDETRDMDKIQQIYEVADTDGDQKLSPAEAVHAYIDFAAFDASSYVANKPGLIIDGQPRQHWMDKSYARAQAEKANAAK